MTYKYRMMNAMEKQNSTKKGRNILENKPTILISLLRKTTVIDKIVFI
ncbi:hypothetical protein [Maribacter aestuarii]|nr:hypothetical protein [Maribacter aestuarii]